jgi:hypothetical protein
MNINFSKPGFNSNSNFYNPAWSNHSNFSWQTQATGNYAPQYHELHHPEYPQFDHQSSHPSSYNYPAQELSFEDTVKAFIQASSQNIQELQKVTMSNSQIIQELTDEVRDSTQFTHQAFAKMEGNIGCLVAKLNGIEEEEFQSQLMAQGHYMIDEDDASHSCHEHVPDTTILKSKEIVDNNEEEDKEEQIEHIDQIEHREQVEHKKKIEPPADTSLSNDKEVSIESHSFITVSFETLYESKASILQCLKDSSYAKILKDLCRQAHKSRNCRPKKIFSSKQVGYLRWRNILPECYQILKKKWWKGLAGHPHDRGRYCNFLFYFLHLIFEFFFLFHLISC